MVLGLLSLGGGDYGNGDDVVLTVAGEPLAFYTCSGCCSCPSTGARDFRYPLISLKRANTFKATTSVQGHQWHQRHLRLRNCILLPSNINGRC